MKLDEQKKQRMQKTKEAMNIRVEIKEDDDDDERVAVIDTGMFSVKIRVCTVTVCY